ncbi:hypothetical protein BIY21_14635 [Vibrio ponticus]|uniref:Uncharacterized protein n=1 Tax=Vibrio ponticus TaxID=265668 RepID=A0ABX3FDN0_9VIBR|nr:hypothetical protein [Vibrio ponticus]OLQ89769.1 hypothetical protein BIY21_14635 [Vibrio ponticus]
MKRKNSHGFLVKYQYPQRLIKWRDEFAKREPIEPDVDPLEPFMSVTDDVLTVREASHGLRFSFLLPLVIGLWMLSFTFIGGLGPNSASVATGKETLIDYREKEQKGVEFNDFHEHWYNYYKLMFNSEGDYSLLSYSNAVFEYGTETQRENLIVELIISTIIGVLTIYFSVFLVKSPRPAEIYFDRKRGIVYTWLFGRLAGCRFENLGYLERKTGLMLYLYSESKKHKGGYEALPITLHPTGKPHLNSELDNDYFFAQIFNFMANGKSALITGESFHRPQPKTYFFIDKRPEPFEERLEQILQREHILPDLYENLKVVN